MFVLDEEEFKKEAPQKTDTVFQGLKLRDCQRRGSGAAFKPSLETAG